MEAFLCNAIQEPENSDTQRQLRVGFLLRHDFSQVRAFILWRL